jgi:alpha-1,2-mannosyltransferase
MALFMIVLSLLVPVILSVVFLPKTLHLVAELVGHRLRHSSRTRRELVLERVATETKAFEAEHTAKSKEDEDWEKVVPSPTGNTVNGRPDAQWNGIVGFFHPFW